MKFRTKRTDQCNLEELKWRLNVYRGALAPRIVELVQRMGDIYIKTGQGEDHLQRHLHLRH